MQYTDCSDQSTHYAYDGWGHLARITDALGQVTEFTHDALASCAPKPCPMGGVRRQWLAGGCHLLARRG